MFLTKPKLPFLHIIRTIQARMLCGDNSYSFVTIQEFFILKNGKLKQMIEGLQW